VVHAGEGVPGAWVKLLPPPSGERAYYLNGFPSRSQPFAVSESRCDDEGNFKLRLLRSGDYSIQAGAQSRCVCEYGPRRFEAHQGAADLVLELPVEGEIEGRILFEDGETLRDWIIGASRGDGRACSVHTDADGRFHFRGLTPGEWLLRPQEQDLNPDVIHTISSGGDLELPPTTSCTVKSGEATRVEIDLRAKAFLSGGVDLAGWEEAECWGSLQPIAPTFSRIKKFDSIQTGVLHAQVDQPGEYALRFVLIAKDRSCNLGFVERLRLESGENRWTLEGGFGALVLVNALDAETKATLLCDLGGSRRASLSVKLGPHAELKVAALPAGTWNLAQKPGDTGREPASVQVEAGASARLEWK
jgi:hypothetical protein